MTDHTDHSPTATGGTDPETTAEEPTAEPKEEPKEEPGLKAKDVTSVRALLEFVYARPGKVSIPAVVAQGPLPDEAERSALVELVTALRQDDPLLSVPPRVIAALDKTRPSPPVRKLLLELMSFAVSRHPALAGCGLAEAFSGDGHADATALLRSVRDEAGAAPSEYFGKDELKTADRRVFEANAVVATALVLAFKERWQVHVLAHHLDEHLWAPKLDATDRPPERAWLAEGAPPAVLGLVSRSWRTELREKDRALQAARAATTTAEEDKHHALRQLAGVEAAKRDAEATLAKREDEVAQLQQALAEEREARRVDNSHAVDDYEHLRAQVVRRLSRHTQLLEDGLHALRHGSMAVAEEYTERIIEGLRTDLDGMRERAPLSGEN